MDWITAKDRALEYLKKLRPMLLLLLAGILLMVLPETGASENTESLPAEVTEPSLQDSLADILGHISGAGNVRVLLTQSAGAETIYQTDESRASDNIRQETVLVTNASREDVGLIKQVNPPVYQGAILLCQGADNANIRLAVVSAVMSVTGLTSDHITVLKMK